MLKVKNTGSIFFISLLFLQSCTQTSSQVNEMLKTAILGANDAVISPEAINNSPYASMYASFDDGAQAHLILALAEPPVTIPMQAMTKQNTQLKWMSGNLVMLVTHNGRLIKTAGIEQGDLLNTSSVTPDPLGLNLTLASTPKTWSRTIDWGPNYRFNYPVVSTFTLIESQSISINNQLKNTDYYIEDVTIPVLDIHYQNQFWIEKENGTVIKSRQKIAPDLPFLSMTILKPYTS